MVFRRAAQELATRLDEATARAATMRLCSPDDHCERAVRAIVAPHLLRAEMRLLQLRFRAVEARRTVEKGLATPEFRMDLYAEQVAGDAQAFQSAQVEEYAKALRLAAQSLVRLAARNPSVAAAATELQTKADVLVRRLASQQLFSLPTPPQLDFDGLKQTP